MNSEDFINILYRKSYVDKISAKVQLLGKNSKLDTYEFIIVRLFTSIIVFIISLYYFKYGYLMGPILTLIYYYLFSKILLNDKIKKRTIKIENEAMHFFEVLTLSLETGRNLIEAIQVTTSNVSGLLSSEFQEAVREVTFGKSLSEALSDMQKRMPSETVSNIILSLTQSNIYGNSIIKSLYQQIDYLREKRKLEVKGRISKVPVLISVVSVFFFVPLLLLIILGPVILDYLG